MMKMKTNQKILIGIGILAVITIAGISLFTLNQPRNERCSWKVTEEDREKYPDLGPQWSMIAGFQFDEERGCVPVGGFKYVEDVVPFKTKDECESACKTR